jgi:hypothetical protein
MQRVEFEGARRAVRGEEGTEKSSLKEVAVTIGALGPWALNQLWIVPTGQAKMSGALNGLNFKKGSNPGRGGVAVNFGLQTRLPPGDLVMGDKWPLKPENPALPVNACK